MIEALAASCTEEGRDIETGKSDEDRRDLRELAVELNGLADRTYV